MPIRTNPNPSGSREYTIPRHKTGARQNNTVRQPRVRRNADTNTTTSANRTDTTNTTISIPTTTYANISQSTLNATALTTTTASSTTIRNTTSLIAPGDVPTTAIAGSVMTIAGIAIAAAAYGMRRYQQQRERHNQTDEVFYTAIDTSIDRSSRASGPSLPHTSVTIYSPRIQAALARLPWENNEQLNIMHVLEESVGYEMENRILWCLTVLIQDQELNQDSDMRSQLSWSLYQLKKYLILSEHSHTSTQNNNRAPNYPNNPYQNLYIELGGSLDPTPLETTRETEKERRRSSLVAVDARTAHKETQV